MFLLLLLTLLMASLPPWSSGAIPEPPRPTDSSSEQMQKCVAGFCLPHDYAKLETPKMDHVNVVNVNTDIMDVLTVNDKEFSVTLTMYFSVKWEEPRLVTNLSLTDGEWVPVDLNFLSHLWVPNIFIYDLRSFSALNVLKKLAGIWIVHTAKDVYHIYYNQATAVTFLCPMRSVIRVARFWSVELTHRIGCILK